MVRYKTSSGNVKCQTGSSQASVKSNAPCESYHATGVGCEIDPNTQVYYEQGVIVPAPAPLNNENPLGIFGTVTAPSNTQTTVVSYIVPTGNYFGLMGFTASGWAHATFFLYANGVLIVTTRTTPAELTSQVLLQANPIRVSEGQTVTVKVSNCANVSVDFDATIFGYLNTV